MRAKTEVDVEGTCLLAGGEFSESSPLDVRIQLRNAELSEMHSIVVSGSPAATDSPLTGQLQGSMMVRGTLRQPSGEGHVRAAGVMVYGQPVRSVDADVEFAGPRWRARNLIAASHPGGITGDVSYNFAGREFAFAVHGANLQLDSIPSLKARRLRIQGALDFNAEGSGTPEAPAINASLQLRDLFVNDERLGEFHAEAVTHGAEMKLTAHSSFHNGSLAADGTIQLRGDMPMALKVVAANLPLDAGLRSFFFSGHAAHAVVDGELDLEGPARNPRAVEGELRMTRLAGSLEGLPVQNSGALRLRLREGMLRVEQFRLEGEQQHYFEMQGQAELSGEQRLNLRAEGKADLKLLQSLAPDLSSRGLAELAVQVRGTVARPTLRGQLRISDGAVSYVDVPNGLSSINGVLVFNQDRLQVQELAASMGGGRLQLGGFVSYDESSTAKSAVAGGPPLLFNLTAEGKNVRLRYPEGVSSGVDVSLAFSGSTSNAVLSGNLTVTRLALNPQFDFTSYLLKGKPIGLGSSPNSPADNIKLDVHVASAPQLQVQSSLARVTGNVNLHIRGTAAKPIVFGRISVLQGNLTLTNTTYRLDRGEITFSNPASIDPNIDIEASTRVRDYDITLGLQGTLNRMNVSYRSDPPLQSADIISLLALGRTEERPSSQPHSTNRLRARF
jgi:translocation and assembly module TamB